MNDPIAYCSIPYESCNPEWLKALQMMGGVVYGEYTYRENDSDYMSDPPVINLQREKRNSFMSESNVSPEIIDYLLNLDWK